MIHYDPWWNVAAQNQATDRAYRIGQEKPVTVYKLILKEYDRRKSFEAAECETCAGGAGGFRGNGFTGDLSQNELMELFEQNP